MIRSHGGDEMKDDKNYKDFLNSVLLDVTATYSVLLVLHKFTGHQTEQDVLYVAKERLEKTIKEIGEIL